MKTIGTCPLGHHCERVVGDHVEVCNWYTEIKGADPQTGQQQQQKSCAIAWLPVLNIEASRTNTEIAVALESGRNSILKRLDDGTPTD